MPSVECLFFVTLESFLRIDLTLSKAEYLLKSRKEFLKNS